MNFSMRWCKVKGTLFSGAVWNCVSNNVSKKIIFYVFDRFNILILKYFFKKNNKILF
jgi:hypothetical protein